MGRHRWHKMIRSSFLKIGGSAPHGMKKKKRQLSTFQENLQTAREGGEVAGSARKDIEARSGGASVITSQNATQLNQVVTNMIEGVTAEETGNSDPKEK